MMNYNYVFRPPHVDISTVYVSWKQDPTSTLLVYYHSEGMIGPEDFVLYRRAGTTSWLRADGSRRQFPGTRRLIHVVEITGLSPDTTYEIMPAGRGRVYKTFTMPADLTNPVRVIHSGDMYIIEQETRRMNQLAASFDPHCIVFGGDWAYADGDPANADRWVKLWEMWMDHVVDSQGRLIPVVPVIGSHEVVGQFGEKQDAPLWYANFAWPDGYGVLDVGDYLSIVVLDTHTNSYETQQSWLEGVLNARASVPYVVPHYKLAAYPSSRPFMDARRALIRELWHPLFDACPGVRVVFEHGEHTYKRTVPIKGGVADPSGIVYCGDGCWGVHSRGVWNPATTWYLDDAKGTVYMRAEDGTPHPDDGQPADVRNYRHFYLVTYESDKMTIDSINKWGETFHSFERHPA